MTHCGLCHSGASAPRDEGGISRHPRVPGHGAIGVLGHLGAAVPGLKPGPRAGVGWEAPGSAPNRVRPMADCPAAPEGLLGLNGALAKGTPDAAPRWRLDLAEADG